jgi:hypothetical protein
MDPTKGESLGTKLMVGVCKRLKIRGPQSTYTSRKPRGLFKCLSREASKKIGRVLARYKG